MNESVMLSAYRGFSVEPAVPSSPDVWERCHRIVFRVVDLGHEDKVVIQGDVPVSLEGSMGFTFCPWCGKRQE